MDGARAGIREAANTPQIDRTANSPRGEPTSNCQLANRKQTIMETNRLCDAPKVLTSGNGALGAALEREPFPDRIQQLWRAGRLPRVVFGASVRSLLKGRISLPRLPICGLFPAVLDTCGSFGHNRVERERTESIELAVWRLEAHCSQ